MTVAFTRQKLSAAQARTVADRRRADALALQSFKRNCHANGAMYLGGIAIELMLKAKLLQKHPWLGRRPSGELDQHQQRLVDLCYRWHDLEVFCFSWNCRKSGRSSKE